jgi:hypothetical protein
MKLVLFKEFGEITLVSLRRRSRNMLNEIKRIRRMRGIKLSA